MSPETTTVVQRIEAGLQDVIDPELGRDVVSLGLIYKIDVSEHGAVSIDMTTTTAGCPAAGFLVDAVRYAAAAVDGVTSAEVHLTYEPHWRPEMIRD